MKGLVLPLLPGLKTNSRRWAIVQLALVHAMPLTNVGKQCHACCVDSQVADSCEQHGAADCEIFPFDLLRTGEIDSLAKKVLADKHIDVLVNNAGIMTAGSAFEGIYE